MEGVGDSWYILRSILESCKLGSASVLPLLLVLQLDREHAQVHEWQTEKKGFRRGQGYRFPVCGWIQFRKRTLATVYQQSILQQRHGISCTCSVEQLPLLLSVSDCCAGCEGEGRIKLEDGRKNEPAHSPTKNRNNL